MRPNRAFTMVELLAVITIMALLALLLLPPLSKAKSAANSAGCVNNLRQIGLHFEMYLMDHEPWEFYEFDFGGIERELRDSPLLTCPEARRPSRLSFYVDDKLWWNPGTARSGYGQKARGYAMNGHLISRRREDGSDELVHDLATVARTPSRTPLMGDGVLGYGFPYPSDELPDSFFLPVTGPESATNHYHGDMAIWCLERHGKGINMVMVDNSVRRFRPMDLWALDWHETFQQERAQLLQRDGSPRP